MHASAAPRRRAARGADRPDERLHRDMHVRPVDRRAAEEREHHHHQHRRRLGPRQRAVHDVAHEHAERNDQRDDDQRGTGDDDAGEVQRFHRLPVAGLEIHPGIPQKTGRQRRPASIPNATATSSLRCAGSAPCAWRRTSRGSAWWNRRKTLLSTSTNFTPPAFSLATDSATIASHSRALLDLRLTRQLGDQRLVLLRHLVPARLREHEDLGDDQVAGEAVELGDLIVVLGEQRRRVVLRPVDDAGLERV